MSKFKLYHAALFAAISCVGLTACSDDKDEPTPNPDVTTEANAKNVFTQGIPTQVGDMTIVANSKGQVTEIKEDGDVIAKFNYDGTKSRATRPTDYDMTMTAKNGDVFYITLNKNGFIDYAVQEENKVDEPNTFEEWWFKYNDKGQMVEMKRTEGDNEVTTIKYNADGDIVEVRVKDDVDGEKHVTTIAYTDATHTTAIVNKSGMMLYDDSFRIDMDDEMAPAFFAGILGKGTAHLPLSAVEKTTIGDYSDTSNYTFQWILNTSDMPTKFISTLTYEGGYTETTDVEFKW